MNRTLPLLAMVVAIAVAGCTTSAPVGVATPGSDAGTHTPPAHSGDAALTYVATDYALAGPTRATAGITKVILRNDGPNLHHLVLARIEGGRTVEDVLEALSSHGPTPTWLVYVGGPNAAEVGESQAAYVDLKEGTYLVYCLVPDMDFVPHVAHGMFRALTVDPASGAPKPAPATAVRLDMRDFAYDGPSVYPRGTIVVAFANTGPAEHEATLVRLDGNTTPDEFLSVLAPDASGERPGRFVGGLSPLAQGQLGWAILDLEPGRYFWLCLVPGPDGAPHFAHGMTQEFSVA